MNKEEDYASDSDQSDEDFCPENGGQDSDAVSADEDDENDDEDDSGDNESESEVEKAKNVSNKKKIDTTKLKTTTLSKSDSNNVRSTRQTGTQQNSSKIVEKDDLESDEEIDKSRSDSLWADFLSDVGETAKPNSSDSNSTTVKETTNNEKHKPVTKTRTAAATPATKLITEVFDFAGEQVTVEKTVPNNTKQVESPSHSTKTASSGPPFRPLKRSLNGNATNNGSALGSLLNQLGKKKKISVLEKSQLDWKTFKTDEGIDEEIQTHNKGKDGYLERQDFLQRTDLRQFEIEKNMRQSRRQN